MTRAIRVALVNDYEVVVLGFNQMFVHHNGRVEVVQLLANTPVDETVDIALYDSFGQGERYADAIDGLLANPKVAKTAIYTWNITPALVTWAKEAGVSACLSKELPASALVDALEKLHRGEQVFSSPTRGSVPVGAAWPGREEGLSYREAEMMSLVVQGLTNAEIARSLFLSPNSVKSYIRTAYRKIGVVRRSQAVAWGIRHGFEPDRIEKDPPAQ